MDYKASSYEIISVVIRYKTTFIEPLTNNPVILSFALGPYISVNMIAGIPLIRQLHLELDFNPEAILSHSLKKKKL